MRKATNAQLRAGAHAVKALITAIHEQSERDLEGGGKAAETGKVDPRDYRAMAKMVEDALRKNWAEATPDHVEGFLRALTDLLCREGDGFSLPDGDWDPIAVTAKAFDGPPARHIGPDPAPADGGYRLATREIASDTPDAAGTIDFFEEGSRVDSALILAAWIERSRALLDHLRLCCEVSQTFREAAEAQQLAYLDAPWDDTESTALSALLNDAIAAGRRVTSAALAQQSAARKELRHA